MTFRTTGKDFATLAAGVRGIVPAGELLQFPGLPFGVVGLAHYRGATLLVLDLAARLHLPPLEKPGRKLVVMELDGGTLIGFLAERICDVLQYHARDLRDGFLHGQGRRRRVIALDQLICAADLNYLQRAV